MNKPPDAPLTAISREEEDHFTHYIEKADSVVVDFYKNGETVVLIERGEQRLVLESGLPLAAPTGDWADAAAKEIDEEYNACAQDMRDHIYTNGEDPAPKNPDPLAIIRRHAGAAGASMALAMAAMRYNSIDPSPGKIGATELAAARERCAGLEAIFADTQVVNESIAQAEALIEFRRIHLVSGKQAQGIANLVALVMGARAVLATNKPV